jgi:Zn-dependent protease with chaperone function
VRADPESATGPGAASVTASVIAACVHGVTLALVVLAPALIVVTPLRALGIVAAVLLLCAAWLTRPRPSKAPDGVRWVDGPQTLRFVRSVAQAAGAPAPHRVGFDEQLNASYTVVGWRRERLLVIGLPLWDALPAQQRVALLGHELGHAAARDSRHLLLVSTALETLHEWMLVCRYETSAAAEMRRAVLLRGESGLVQLSEMFTRWLLALVGLVPAATYGLLLVVTQRQSQRAEYGADIAGTRVAGRTAMTGALSTLMESDALDLAMRRTVMGADRGDVLAAIRAESRQLAASGWPSRRNRRRNGPYDSHPPDDLRRALVATLPELPPAVVLDPVSAQSIDAEIDDLRGWVNRRVYDRFHVRWG